MLALLLPFLVMNQTPDPVLDGFNNVPQESRMRMYWQIFGPAWERPEIDRQLNDLKTAGVGGVTAYFMYPVVLDDQIPSIKNQTLGSPEFLDTLGYAAQAAKQRGLRFGATLGSGWPYGGPSVTPQDAAKKLRLAIVKPGQPAPTLAPNERVVATFQDGLLARDPDPQKEQEVFISGPTGMNVKRAAQGGEGAVLDHFNKPALDRFLASVALPWTNAAPAGLSWIFCDSLEVYGSNWCDDLPIEFQKRRGYDLIPRLTDLFDENSPNSPGLRFDFWRTLMELTEERFTKPLGDWARARNMSLEMEAYGTPPNPMTAAKYIDLPTGEHYEWKGFSVQKFVASTAHIAGKPIVGSEAWTWIGLPNRLNDTLDDIKLSSDMAFVAGCNDLTGVDFPYSPKAAGQPGWQPYYGPTMNENNPQWPFFPALVGYLNRCQWMLRQGRPVRDIAVYLPVEDALPKGGLEQMQLDFLVRDHFVTGKATSEFGLTNAKNHHSDLLHGIMNAGFDYDGLDFFAVERMGRVRGRELQVGDGSYKAIVLPDMQTIDLPALRKVAAFCRAGGLVVAQGSLPQKAAGRSDWRNDLEVKDTVDAMFSSTAENERRYGKGVTFWTADPGEVATWLEKRINAPVAFVPPLSQTDAEMAVIKRALPDRDVYFLANLGDTAGVMEPVFRSKWSTGVLMDPMTGSIKRATLTPLAELSGGSLGPLDMPAHSSLFVVLGGPSTTYPVYRREASLEQEIDLPGPWQVSFAGPDAPAAQQLSELESWTQVAGGRYFSGQATYTESFALEKAPTLARLDLGSFRAVAQIWINGESAGTVLSPGQTLEITNLLREGKNELKVVVGNTPVSRFLGLPDEDLKPLRAVYGGRFSAPEEKQLMPEPPPSGLLGPVRLLTSRQPRLR